MKVIIISGINFAHVQHNVLSDQEKQNGWSLLFDGQSTDEWRSYNGDRFPDSGWIVEDGALIVESNGEGGI